VKKALIKSGHYNIEIDFLDTHTAKVIYSELPIISKVNLWGHEVYFHTDLKIKIEKEARQIVEKGEIAYWSQGDAIAIGYGPTPISINQEIRLVSDCNIWAKTEYDLEQLNSLKEQQEIIITHEKNL
jgi:hypothetical protein